MLLVKNTVKYHCLIHSTAHCSYQSVERTYSIACWHCLPTWDGQNTNRDEVPESRHWPAGSWLQTGPAAHPCGCGWAAGQHNQLSQSKIIRKGNLYMEFINRLILKLTTWVQDWFCFINRPFKISALAGRSPISDPPLQPEQNCQFPYARQVEVLLPALLCQPSRRTTQHCPGLWNSSQPHATWVQLLVLPLHFPLKLAYMALKEKEKKERNTKKQRPFQKPATPRRPS